MNLDPERQFTLHRRGDIFAIVDRLRRERVLTTVEFADGHAIVSSVLDIRRDHHAMVFDVAGDADQNRRLFASQTLGFVTELDRVQIAFETGAASLLTLADGPAAVVRLPSAVVRLQRRESFRALLPVVPPIRCTLLDQDGNATPACAIDLSAGGAAFVVEGPLPSSPQPGSDHELIFSLPDVGRIELEATLRTVMPEPGSTRGSTSKVRIGFRFESVPQKIANQIQRYVQHVEVHQLRVLRMRN